MVIKIIVLVEIVDISVVIVIISEGKYKMGYPYQTTMSDLRVPIPVFQFLK